MEHGEYGQPPQVYRAEIIFPPGTDPDEELSSHWTYQDVLWLGLAGLPKGDNKLTAKLNEWCEVIAQLQDQTRGLAPELLEDVHFSLRRGFVHSYQVSRFWKILTEVHWNPMDTTINISEETKAYAIEKYRPKLVEYEEAIQLMSRQLQSLVVTP